VYAEVVKRASKIVLCHADRPLSDGHAGRLLLERNKRMIDDAPTDYLIAAWNGETGGTSHCVRYATPKVGCVINLLGCDSRGQRIEPDCRNQYDAERKRAVKDGVVCV
jgi:N-acetylglutamate synthase-like GNAT family acetyltransferase